MRQLGCACGISLSGVDDEELLRLGPAHADVHHPDDGITDEFIRQHVCDNAVDVAS
jgi:hypothetical protein